jgi:hypothetical protein
MRASDDIGACKLQNPKPTTRPHDYVLCFSRERERREEFQRERREENRRGNPCPLPKINTYPK